MKVFVESTSIPDVLIVLYETFQDERGFLGKYFVRMFSIMDFKVEYYHSQQIWKSLLMR